MHSCLQLGRVAGSFNRGQINALLPTVIFSIFMNCYYTSAKAPLQLSSSGFGICLLLRYQPICLVSKPYLFAVMIVLGLLDCFFSCFFQNSKIQLQSSQIDRFCFVGIMCVMTMKQFKFPRNNLFFSWFCDNQQFFFINFTSNESLLSLIQTFNLFLLLFALFDVIPAHLYCW